MRQLIILLFTAMLTTISQAQDWLDRSLYPFDSHYFELDPGKLHYLDEGQGEVLLFVHGTPTWSFLYRDLIQDLSQDYRCIAIDHLGFGLSDKPVDFPGTPEAHSRNLSTFIQALDLENITLVVHDFGGPIGLGAGLDNHQRIKRVVLFNSWLWSTQNNPVAMEIDGFLNSEVGEDLYLNQNYSPVVLLKQAFADTTNLSAAAHQHYIAPFPTPATRQSLLRIGRSFVGSSGWYEEQWKKLALLEDKDWLILWGEKDLFLDVSYRNRWSSRLPQAKVISFDVGHFVQEEETEAAIDAIRAFLKE